MGESTWPVAVKILHGVMLSREEYISALHQGIYLPVEDIDAGYESLKESHYDSPTQRGYLCGKHRSAHISSTTFCGWGLHYEDIDVRHLSTGNLKYLAASRIIPSLSTGSGQKGET